MQKHIHKHIENFLPNETHVPGHSLARIMMGVFGGVGILSLVSGIMGISVDASNVGQSMVYQAPRTKKVSVKANAGADQTVTLPATSITLDGTGSTGTIAKYVWKQTKGPKKLTITDSNKSVATLTNLVKGTYTFELKVSSARYMSSKDTVIVTIKSEGKAVSGVKKNTNAGDKTTPTTPTEPQPVFNYPGTTPSSVKNNKSPVANAGADQTLTLPTNKTKINAFKSSDSDGYIALINWKQISGPTKVTLSSVETNMEMSTSELSVGTYVFELSITDDKGAVSTDKVNVIVK